MSDVRDRPTAPLIGRDHELAILSAALERAVSGHPRFVVVAGETGIGKTRLVTELLRRHRTAALVGACIPVAGEGLPLVALAQGLRRLARTEGGQRVLSHHPDLLSILPSSSLPMAKTPVSVGTGEGRNSGPATVRVTEPPPVLEVGPLQRLRLSQSVLGLLGRLGRERGVVHVIEDVHWADPSTRDLIRFLAANLVNERVLTVLTCRAEDLVAGSPLVAWLGDLGRLPRVERLDVSRLDASATRTLVGAFIGDNPDWRDVHRISGRSDGNPLFAQHLAWDVGTGRQGLPTALRELLGGRITALPRDARSLVDAASVLSASTSVEVLSQMGGSSAEEADEALTVALDHSILQMVSGDLVNFTHPALREITYANLLPTLRRRLHLAAGRSLSQPGAAADVSALAIRSEIARHLHLGGDLAMALEAAWSAALLAERTPAFAEALANYRRVLDLIERVPHKLDRVDVLRRAARSAELIGDEAAAIDMLEEALRQPLSDHERSAVLEQLGDVHFLAGRGEEAYSALEQALRSLPSDAEPVLEAKVHAGLAMVAATWSRLDEAEAAALRVLRITKAGVARREAGRAHNALALVATGRGDAQAATGQIEEALMIAREVGDPDTLGQAWGNLTHVLGLGGQDLEVVKRGRDAIDELTKLGLAPTTGIVLLGNIVESLIKLGRYREAQAYATLALELHPPGIFSAAALMRAGDLALRLGELDGARLYAAEAQRVVFAADAPAEWIAEVNLTSAQVENWLGHSQRALELVRAALDPAVESGDQLLPLRLVTEGLRALGDLAETGRDEQARNDRNEMAGWLLAYVEGAESEEAAAPEELTLRAELTRARGSPSPMTWEAAAQAWDDAGRTWESAYSLWRLAEARLAEGMGPEAVSAVREGHQLSTAEGFATLVEEFTRLAVWYRIDLLERGSVSGRQANSGAGADPQSPQPPGSSALESYHLTPRELQVLRSLTAGGTNSQIAVELGMSVKTASVHVSSILRKLQVSDRKGAARLAYRLGLG